MGYSYVGGLVGHNVGSIVESSYSVGTTTKGISNDGAYSYVGGLVGLNDSDAVIESCYSVGSINGLNDGGNNYASGLVGHNKGLITFSYFAGSITGNNNVGGLAGLNDGSIESCYSTSSLVISGNLYIGVGGLVSVNRGSIIYSYFNNSVKGTSNGTGVANVGGLVGSNVGGLVKNSYSKGSVTAIGGSSASEINVGGLIGRTSSGGSIERSWSSSTVNGSRNNPNTYPYVNAGGLIGSNGVYLSDPHPSIRYSYSLGSVTASNNNQYVYTGGLVGDNSGLIEFCYSMSSVKVTNGSVVFVGGLVGGNGNIYTNPGASVKYSYATGLVTGSASSVYTGGLIASNGGSVTNSYWNTQTSSQSSSAGGTGKTTAQMKTQSTFSGWNFTNIWAISSNTYPYLRDNIQSPYPQ